jgi:ABC-type xylose transport system permease subunit
MFVRILPLGLVVIAVACVLIAALTPVSRQKGRIRLAGSLCIGAAFLIGSVSQILTKGKSIPALIGALCGVFLVWVGLRKYRRDPEGRSPSAQIL